jgi:hypothetical protein
MSSVWYGLTKTAMRVAGSTDPASALKNATLTIIDDCTPPQIKYPVKCGIFLAQLGIAVSSGGNPWAVAITVGSARSILE